MMARRDRVPALAFAAALAVPAFLLTNESFRPVAERFRFEGPRATGQFALAFREPLFLEYEAVVRAPGGGRPVVRVRLNDVLVATVGADAVYRRAFGKLQMPLAAVRDGPNELVIDVEGSAGATFTVDARVTNYYGIAPDFPRAFVVSDEAFAQLLGQRSIARSALRFGLFYLGGVLLLLGLARASGRHVKAGWHAPLWSPAIVLLLALGYSLATPLHIWLSPEASLVVTVTPWMLAALVFWIGTRRVAAARVAVATGLTIGLLEVTLRAFNYVSPSFIFYSDSFGRYRGQPGAPHFDSRLNSKGFNDVERQLARPSHVTARVVAIGDSFTFGVVPYSANYLTLAERELGRDAPVEIVKMGVSGTETRDYLAILVEEGLSYGPDVVVAGFYVGNDFEVRERKPYERSYLTTLGYFLWSMGRAGRTVTLVDDSERRQYDDAAGSLEPDVFLQVLAERSWIYTASDERLATAAGRAAGYLREMRDLAERSGSEFLVVVMPDEVQVAAGVQQQLADVLGRSGEEIDFVRPTNLIVGMLERQGIRVLNLLPAFADAGRGLRLYKPHDTHWNLAGNRLAAATLAPALRDILSARRVQTGP
jgi:hypothetical protein